MNGRESRSLTRDPGGAVDQGKDHATEGPGDPLDAHRGALAAGLDHAHDREDGDVEEEEGSHELRYPSPVEGPRGELPGLEQGSRWRLLVVLVALGCRSYRLPLRELVCSQPHIFFFAFHLPVCLLVGKRQSTREPPRVQETGPSAASSASTSRVKNGRRLFPDAGLEAKRGFCLPLYRLFVVLWVSELRRRRRRRRTQQKEQGRKLPFPGRGDRCGVAEPSEDTRLKLGFGYNGYGLHVDCCSP
ncbi:hypothetical protein B296_00000950 [Ensete ventricosum]|uniref:Uncharacterized protein n=1 Tax=Ensete ventricosum TaxID=4639 RepID=A0A427ANS4_ENSVE|nr:hypothetical protein B296_00000950 [Ensete ventricosum]